ncbi:hypothetical protein ACDX78_11740 [Virgibacillus oceani]
MNSEKKVRFAEGTLHHIKVETTVFSPENQELGVAMLSEENDGGLYYAYWHRMKNPSSPIQLSASVQRKR